MPIIPNKGIKLVMSKPRIDRAQRSSKLALPYGGFEFNKRPMI